MAQTETVARVVDQLTREGYLAQFRAEPEGLRVPGGGVYDPADVVVERMARFEGITDPDDECVVFGLRAPDGTRGTWAPVYGPEGKDRLEQEALARLVIKEPPEIM